MAVMFSSKKKLPEKRMQSRTLLDEGMSFAVVEAYKTLRTNIVFALSTKNSKTFAVSSSLFSEGKSTSSTNLAISFSQIGKRVLIIDCDLRKPVQHRNFKLTNEKGLTTLLGGLNTFSEVLNKSVIPNLDVVTCGPIPPNPSEMLASDNMKALLEQLEKHYDYIILDTPPVNIVTDALTLSGKIAGIALVARSGQTGYDDVNRAIRAIEFAEIDLLGIIVTDIKSEGGSYSKYKYKYGYKHSYGHNYIEESNKEEQTV